MSVNFPISVERVPRGDRFRPIRAPWQSPNQIEEFIALPRHLEPRDPLRLPLLDLEQADLVDRHAHPFYKSDGKIAAGEAEFFIARRRGVPVGRIAAILNPQHNAFESRKHKRAVRAGYFGFYDAIPDQSVANVLLDAARGWLVDRGMTEMVGPASPSHNYYYGSRAISEEIPPQTDSRFLEASNPEFYNQHFIDWGLEPIHRMFGYDVDLHAPSIEALASRMEQAVHGPGVVIRRLDLDDFDDEITRANELINRSLAENWGFSPMTRAELAHMSKQMRMLIDPRLVLFLEFAGEPVGISLAMPDYNQLFAAMKGRLTGWPSVFRFGNLPLIRTLWPHGNAWATREIDVCRVIALGVVPKVKSGANQVRREFPRLGPALLYETFRNAREAGYRHLTASWILEDNRAMRAPFKMAGISPGRVWRLYGRAI